MSLTNLIKKAMIPIIPVAALSVGASSLSADQDHEEYHGEFAVYCQRWRRVENPQGILHGPNIQNGEAKIDGPKPIIGGPGWIEIGFRAPIHNYPGADIEVHHTNGGLFDVYARDPDPSSYSWVYLGRGSGHSYFELGYLPYTTELRIQNPTLMKNIKIDWVKNLHPYSLPPPPPPQQPPDDD